MNHIGIATLETARLTLRPVRPDDAADVFVWMSDPEVNKFERWPLHETVTYSRGYINAVFDDADPRNYQWGIDLDGRLIGTLSVVDVDDHDQKATMGYVLARAQWNQGYATEAVRAVLAYMFDRVGINRIEASHAIGNVASGRVLEKAGFAREGEAKEFFRTASGFQDSTLWGITRSRYMAMKLENEH